MGDENIRDKSRKTGGKFELSTFIEYSMTYFKLETCRFVAIGAALSQNLLALNDLAINPERNSHLDAKGI